MEPLKTGPTLVLSSRPEAGGIRSFAESLSAYVTPPNASESQAFRVPFGRLMRSCRLGMGGMGR